MAGSSSLNCLGSVAAGRHGHRRSPDPRSLRLVGRESFRRPRPAPLGAPPRLRTHHPTRVGSADRQRRDSRSPARLLRRTRYHLGGLRHLDVHGADEIVIGYAFFPEFWGRGFATEIARTCVAIARDRLGPESVVSDALPTNAASRRVMVKAGLVYERDVTLDGIPLVLYRSPPLSSWALDEVYEL